MRNAPDELPTWWGSVEKLAYKNGCAAGKIGYDPRNPADNLNPWQTGSTAAEAWFEGYKATATVSRTGEAT